MSARPRCLVVARLWPADAPEGELILRGRWGAARVLVVENPAAALRPSDAPYLLMLQQIGNENRERGDR